MGIKKALFNIKGMTRDLAASKFNPEFAYENRNMRILATDSNTSGVLTNEKGNLKVENDWFVGGLGGTPIGQATLDDNLILFVHKDTAQSPDSIHRLYFDDDELVDEVLYEDNLNFQCDHPIESISVYESDQLKKVYWTDGANQPRVINIAADASRRAKWRTMEDPFDFVRKLNLREDVTISRDLVANGSFAPGVVQYFMTYYNLYGQESNIFYSSPLYYISYNDRGADAADVVGVSFSFEVKDYDTSYEYLRIYCIHRTSLDATPQARKVVDIAVPTSGSIYYTDYGVTGETIDPTNLLFVGGKPTKVGTITQKDNTLFLGNLHTSKTRVSSDIQSSIQSLTVRSLRVGTCSDAPASGYYSYSSHLNYNSYQNTTFKSGEYYRLGIQLQDNYGVWSDPIWVEDYYVPESSRPMVLNSGSTYSTYYVIHLNARIPDALVATLKAAGYSKIRPVVVYPSITERHIVCQGVLCPTVYNAEDRYNDSPTSMSSWFFRPNAPYNARYGLEGYAADPTYYDDTMSPVMSNENYRPQGARTWEKFDVNNGKWAEFRHNKKIPGNSKGNAEIQCIVHPPEPFLNTVNEEFYTEPSDPAQWVADNKECFYVDQSIVTFHSPDIEFDKNVRSIDASNLKLRIVGYVPITSHVSSIDIQATTPPLNYSKGSDEEYPEIAPGLYKEKVSYAFTSSGGFGWKSALSGAYWLDELYGSSANNNNKLNVGFIVYPWHRSGSLNNTRTVKSGSNKSAMLSQKKMSILRHSFNTEWLGESSFWYADSYNGISGISIFDSEENTIVKLPTPQNSGMKSVSYSGNIDKLITFHTTAKVGTNSAGNPKYLDRDTDNFDLSQTTASFYPIIAACVAGADLWEPRSDRSAETVETHNFRSSDSHVIFSGNYQRLRKMDDNVDDYSSRSTQSCSNDPVYMKYKSTPHAVLALNYTSNHKQVILPTHNSTNIVGSTIDKCCPSTYSTALFWDNNQSNAVPYITGVVQDSISISNLKEGYLWMAELYNDNLSTDTIFGGKTPQAFENNQWLPAGRPVLLDTDEDDVYVTWEEGDTYYQRYDCLKTYPFTMEDQNSIVDILSFMCETRVNIDGRYDRNRGQTDNLYMTPKIFNLFNSVYSQKDNFFSYRGDNEDKLLINNFPNTITWTKTKTLGEEIDSWTNITLASTLDLDGNLGELRALRRFKDGILSFQDSGISQILYNENIQIASTTGVPIEIANSGKVSGKRYISDKIGCTNKWSICSTPNGLYFYDGLSKDLYLFNGEFNNLSDRLGFHSWVVNNLNSINPWTPTSFDGCITYYDKVNNDVLFITKDDCLAFSETLGQFSSFYDYGDTPFFANIKDRGIAIHKDADDDKYFPFLHHEGEYNMFYEALRPYWTTVVVNPNPTTDKIFNNLEFRADSFNSEGIYMKDYTFDYLNVWNEYQEGESDLTTLGVVGATHSKNAPSSLKKKFRVWRANIPRWNIDKNGQTANCRDRMRNPWLYLKLEMKYPDDLSTKHKTVLHDLVVDYFE